MTWYGVSLVAHPHSVGAQAQRVFVELGDEMSRRAHILTTPACFALHRQIKYYIANSKDFGLRLWSTDAVKLSTFYPTSTSTPGSGSG